MTNEQRDEVTTAADAAQLAEETRAERNASIAKNTFIVTAFVALGRVIGMLRTPILARFIGTTGIGDVFFFAYDTILRDLYTKVEKLLQPTFIPLFVGRRETDGEEPAWRFASVFSTLHFLLVVTLGVTGAIAAEPIVRWLAQGHTTLMEDPQKMGLCISFVRLFFPALIPYSMSNVTELMLQSHRRFALAAFAEAFVRVAMLIVLVAAVVLFHQPTVSQATQALVWGGLLGVLGRLLIMLPGLWRTFLARLRPSLALSNPDMRRAFVLMLPLIAAILLAYARNIAEAKMAFSFGEGAFSALRYARKFVDLPWQILGLAVSMVIYPFISQLSAREDHGELAHSLMATTRILTFFFLPVMAACYVLSEQMVRIAYVGQKFTEHSLQQTLVPLLCYLPGLVFFAIEDPLLKWFYAMKDTKIPVLLGVMSDVLWATVAFVGVLGFHAELQALALALVVSKGIKVVVAFAILNRRIGPLEWGPFVGFLGRMVVATAVMSAAAYVTCGATARVLPFQGTLLALGQFMVVSLVCLVTAGIMVAVLHIEEGKMVANQLGGKLLAKLRR